MVHLPPGKNRAKRVLIRPMVFWSVCEGGKDRPTAATAYLAEPDYLAGYTSVHT